MNKNIYKITKDDTLVLSVGASAGVNFMVR